jgi:hypothetical protein
MVTFQQAYEAAAARYAPEDWASLSAPKIIQVIYEEMRRLDAEDAGVMVDAHLTGEPRRSGDDGGRRSDRRSLGRRCQGGMIGEGRRLDGQKTVPTPRQRRLLESRQSEQVARTRIDRGRSSCRYPRKLPPQPREPPAQQK